MSGGSVDGRFKQDLFARGMQEYLMTKEKARELEKVAQERKGSVFFVEVKVNESQPKKYQKASLRMAKEYGFRTYVLRLSIGIHVEESSIQLIET